MTDATTPAEQAQSAATAVVERVAARLADQGAVIELGQLSRLSPDEIEILVRREMGDQ